MSCGLHERLLFLLQYIILWDVWFFLHGADVTTPTFPLTPVTPYDNAGRRRSLLTNISD